MRAGELDRQIVIESATETQNGIGEPIKTWSTFATVWAKAKQLRGREYVAAQAINAEIDTVFTIRWLAGVTRKMRILYDAQYFDIHDIAEIGRREGLDVMARVHRG